MYSLIYLCSFSEIRLFYKKTIIVTQTQYRHAVHHMTFAN